MCCCIEVSACHLSVKDNNRGTASSAAVVPSSFGKAVINDLEEDDFSYDGYAL